MHKLERKEVIIKILEEKGFVKIKDLYLQPELKDVSSMTLNRDLHELKESGLLETVWGGIQKPGYSFIVHKEASREDKASQHILEKIKIAKIAADLIKPGEVIYIGTGTTLEEIVHYLNGKNITLVTNSHFVVLNAYKYPNIKLVVAGGELRERSGAYIGSLATHSIKTFHFNRCFIGAVGVDSKGIYTSNVAEREINRIALNNSQQRYLLVTGDKLNQTGFIHFYDTKKLNVIITTEVDPEIIKNYPSNIKFMMV